MPWDVPPARIPLVATRGSIEAEGHGVMVFSLEMPKEQLALRMMCSEARVDLGKLRQGLLTDADRYELGKVSSWLASLPIFIDDTPALTLQEIRGRIRRKQAEYNRPATATAPEKKIALIVIDYLQLMQGREGAPSREIEISELSRGLKQIAKELGVAILVLSQLNRAVETRGKNARPQLSDLRESGAIEQDADIIVFIYRDEMTNPTTTNVKGIAEFIISKQRNGSTGTVLLHFASECTRFDNLADHLIPPDWVDPEA